MHHDVHVIIVCHVYVNDALDFEGGVNLFIFFSTKIAQEIILFHINA